MVSLAHTLELLISEDRDKFEQYEARFSTLADRKLRRTARHEYQLLLAEAYLQWAFVYLKFGEEVQAAAQLRKAYNIAEECYRFNPDFAPIQKTYGILSIIVGAVPEKYNWILSLLGMKGTIDGGLHQLRILSESDSPLALEAQLLRALTYGFVLQAPDSAKEITDNALNTHPGNRLVQYIAATISLKNAQSEQALPHLLALAEDTTTLPIPYAHYLLGEVYLHKGSYAEAISSYRWFINHYSGQNYLKDAHYKIGLCQWLSGNTNDAEMMFREARKVGKESSEADRSAGMTLVQEHRPHVVLTRARYAMDGGYLDRAAEWLATLQDKDLPLKRDQVEYFYRKARLSHARNELRAARLFYQQTIDLAGDEPWYFAPNACLQLGYIFTATDKEQARRYFRRALSYKKHEYKNSIDSKARSALNRLN